MFLLCGSEGDKRRYDSLYSSILSASVFGLTARKIRVEADVSNGLPGAVMVVMKAAIENHVFDF